ncbi:hypothetical protein AB0H63_31315, partial [Micromonospora echinospora]
GTTPVDPARGTTPVDPARGTTPVDPAADRELHHPDVKPGSAGPATDRPDPSEGPSEIDRP